MTRGAMAAAEARQWLGTPFRWQGSAKRVGCDCKGLIAGIARALGFPEAETFYAGIADYAPHRAIDSALLKAGLAAVFDPADDVALGDVLLVKVAGKPVHLAIVSGDNRAIHAQAGEGERDWVKETRIDALLKLFPLDSIWRWRA